jgi:hypothetical protein
VTVPPDPGPDNAQRTLGGGIAAKFAASSEGALDPVPADPGWRPDVATLSWLLESVDTDYVARAMMTDVPPRQEAQNDYTENTMWHFAADAAIEATFVPAVRRAGELLKGE